MRELFDVEKLKKEARSKINNGIRDGKIVRPRLCQMCGRHTETQGHHFDPIGHPDSVTWVCRPCHKVANKQQQERSFNWDIASTIGQPVASK